MALGASDQVIGMGVNS